MLCQIYNPVVVEAFGKFHLQFVASNIMAKHFPYKKIQLFVRNFSFELRSIEFRNNHDMQSSSVQSISDQIMSNVFVTGLFTVLTDD